MRTGHPEHLGGKVRERRRHLNLTLDGVRAAGGPTGPTIVRTEAGELQDPRPSTLTKFDDALQWTPGSAARVFWDHGNPSPLSAVRPNNLDPGVAAVPLPLQLVLDLLTTQRRLNDFTETRDSDSDELRAICASLTTNVSGVVGMFVTDLLERNYVENGTPGVHPLLEYAFGDVLDGPVTDGDPSSEELLYRRWLMGKTTGLSPNTMRDFKIRLDQKLAGEVI